MHVAANFFSGTSPFREVRWRVIRQMSDGCSRPSWTWSADCEFDAELHAIGYSA